MAAEEKLRTSGESQRTDEGAGLPTVEKPFPPPPKAAFHPAVYVTVWIILSSTVILFNKWLIDKQKFEYPIILTTWHLIFATIMTQSIARTTTLLDARHTVKMSSRLYVRAILPIAALFSLSLIFGNLTYLHLSVAFIQMLKATTPVAVLLVSWTMGVATPNWHTLFEVSLIVLGVVIATFGEITFVLIGFVYQCAGIVFEALRLVLVQKLLNGAEHKMDPLVSLYYFAPVCALMNAAAALWWEVPYITMHEIYDIGAPVLLANALVAFLLNVSAVFLIGRTSSLILTLCGVLKDVLLVATSMLLWQTPVSPLQFLGYFIALSGLLYYKLGLEQLRSVFQDMASRRVAVSRFVVVLCGAVSVFLLVALFAPERIGLFEHKGDLGGSAGRFGFGRYGGV